MQLYLVRHGVAGNRETWEGDDALRPLTEKGKQKLHTAADGLKTLNLGVDRMVTSPLVRARQTADILGKTLHLSVEEQATLSPGFGLEQLAGLLTNYAGARGIMLVGHEPDFSILIGRLIATRGDAKITMKKGACCALDLPDETTEADHAAKRLAGSATLLWLMTARQLGQLAH